MRKAIEHAKTFYPELSEEAEGLIIDYWARLDTKIFPTNRVLETIVRVSKAFARLHFSNLVTSEIAKEAIEFLVRMFQAFDINVVVVQDPREAACQEIAKFLTQNPNIPYDFQDCINYAASNNTLVEAYLGKSPVNNNSPKYRDIADRFKQGLVGEGLISIVDMRTFYKILCTLYIHLFTSNRFSLQFNYSPGKDIHKNRCFSNKNEMISKLLMYNVYMIFL